MLRLITRIDRAGEIAEELDSTSRSYEASDRPDAIGGAAARRNCNSDTDRLGVAFGGWPAPFTMRGSRRPQRFIRRRFLLPRRKRRCW